MERTIKQRVAEMIGNIADQKTKQKKFDDLL